MNFIYDRFGRRHKASHWRAAEDLENLKAKSGSNPWPVISKCIEMWTGAQPKKWKSYLYYLKDTKDSRKVSSVGGKRFRGVSRSDRKNDALLAYTLDIPEPIYLMIRALYTVDELPMDKEFFREFAQRYPIFRVLERNT